MDTSTESTPIPKYETTVFTLTPDNFGPNKATLLHARTMKKSDLYKAVLYIHGYNDYYFQHHICARFLNFGYDFFAIDLRKCGRSLISPEQNPYKHYCTDMHVYDEEISLAIEHMNKQAEAYANKKFALLGHSTGGLTASLYALSGPKRDDIDALILNSPNLVELDKTMVQSVLVNLLIATNGSRDIVAGWNGRSLHVSHKGEWDFDTTMKPIDTVRVHGSFFTACRRAQRELAQHGSSIKCPILFMSSDRSLKCDSVWRDEYAEVDLVLNVENIRRAAAMLGQHVTICSIEKATHDIFLSKLPAREKAFKCMFRWLASLESEWLEDT
ncbi:unnamed protein product [Rotaria magnacalcarata]|uniref:Serine aminopeptidase S33 domain-containing protein n=2 Tax=Rotaria magnacalcarata TaxID=392030 RepID=A0A816HBL5_9BILA|nr:unnamed protein product [Rotaria magnacalcarata]CAF1911201.1 unnamed protein product [Rotaria magnacalcarata]CAF3959927.1 unnamed protein product [Rotaria magnacalcarata]